MGDAETLAGARNRLMHVARSSAAEGADFVVAIEGGVEWCRFSDPPQLMCFAWGGRAVDVRARGGRGGGGRRGARTAAFMLPPPLSELVQGGMELGAATDEVFSQQGSKSRGGTVGHLTNGEITRQTYYEHAITLALIPSYTRHSIKAPPILCCRLTTCNDDRLED
ncbi:hypothetical protein CLOM_g9174 [Closterium sp. NIES-68]|nr:hypothetical protein CLOM_g9174 [Closterium sp. NIES-68]